MRPERRAAERGFVRELVWVTLVVLIAAVAVFDAVSLYSAYERVRKDSDDAARLARQTHLQVLSASRARQAARALLERRGDEMTGFDTEGGGEETVFIVDATRHVDTFAFGYLAYVPGIDDWVKRTVNPSASARSD